MISGETNTLTTPVTRCTSSSMQEVDLRLIPRLPRLQIADNATSKLHFEVGLSGRCVRKTRSIDLDVAAAVGSLRRKSTALSSARRSTNSRPCRPHVSIGHTPDRLFETVSADELDCYWSHRHGREERR